MGGEDDTFWCCNGSAVEEYNKLADTIYFNDGRNVWVNLFLDFPPGLEGARHPDGAAHPFPQEAAHPPGGGKGARRRPGRSICAFPSWTSDAARVLINGKPLDAAPTPGSYLRIARKWKKGDEVVLEMPMTLADRKFRRRSFMLQAVLMARSCWRASSPRATFPRAQTKQHGPNLQTNTISRSRNWRVRAKAPHEWLKPETAPLTYRTVGIGQDIVLKPIMKARTVTRSTGRRFEFPWRRNGTVGWA